jgi:RNA polymerase sigma factor (sigma-70 family)
MTLNQKEWNKLFAYAKIINGDEDEAKDLVQNFLLFLLENETKYPKDSVNNSWCFKTMKSIFLLEIQRNNRQFRKNFFEDYFHINKNNELTTIDELSEMKEEDLEKQDKLNTISETYDQLPTYDKQLYYLHFVKGMSQRKIASETDIKLIQIHYRVKKIKDKIKDNFNNKQNGKKENS